jgi:hypothetical protein
MTAEVDKIAAAISSSAGVGAAIRECYARARTLDAAGKRDLLVELDGVLRSGPPQRLADVAVLAGAIVEVGGDPRDFPSAVFDQLAAMLGEIPADAGDELELPDHFYLFERAAMACLQRSPEMRRRLPQRGLLQARIRRYSERYGFLGKMLSVLDDAPVVVLHPSSERGYRFKLGGVADNFQLHTLLLAALAGKGPDRIEGIVPAAAAVAAAGDGPNVRDLTVESTWQLANWFALRPGRTLVGETGTDDYMRAWIWNEGVPADIEPFDGLRVVLIGPSTIHRSWNSGRVFPAMPGRLVGEADLSAAEVRALLGTIEDRAARGGGRRS